MSKIIIDNRSCLEDSEALDVVKKVINAGRISNFGKQYCYLSIWKCGIAEVQVAAEQNKRSDRFIIMNEE